MITEKITSGQSKQINRFIEDAIDSIGITKDEAQEIIMSGGILQNELKSILKKLAIADKRFGPAIKDFEITVPADYVHETQLGTFSKKNKKKFYYYNNELTDKNYANATNKLAPGKAYAVKIFPILSNVSSEDCVAFLRKQNAILAGAQGLSLLWDLNKEQFPKGKYSVSFDEKDALWQDSDGRRRVPIVLADAVGDFHFYLAYCDGDWFSDCVLVCFCDIQPLKA